MFAVDTHHSLVARGTAAALLCAGLLLAGCQAADLDAEGLGESHEHVTATGAVSLWSDTTRPPVESADDSAGVALGVRFRSAVDGQVTHIRFYRGVSGPLPIFVDLWRADGTRLATAGAYEGLSRPVPGWQQIALPRPVAIRAGETYVASYYAPAGGYAVTQYYFTSRGYTNGPLTAPRSRAASGNGVFRYGAYGPDGLFPAASYRESNYWVDVVFATAPTGTPCGGEGPGCPAGSYCDSTTRVCVACAAGTVPCGNACIPAATLETDPNNCGACGRLCGSSQVCAAGACVCPAGTVECPAGSTICADLQTDPQHCGACGNACLPGEAVCSAGACTPTACAGFHYCDCGVWVANGAACPATHCNPCETGFQYCGCGECLVSDWTCAPRGPECDAWRSAHACPGGLTDCGGGVRVEPGVVCP